VHGVTANGSALGTLQGGPGITIQSAGNDVRGNVATANVVGIAAAPGATGNTIVGNSAHGNRNFDLEDDNAGCDSNTWNGNDFGTGQPVLHPLRATDRTTLPGLSPYQGRMGPELEARAVELASQGCTQAEISAQLNISKGTVGAILGKHGARSDLGFDRARQIVGMQQQGMSQAEIARPWLPFQILCGALVSGGATSSGRS
jgi:hypothetical protein